ncbi:autotransporter assembly complex family protein [Thiomicrorhabdus hydrogeniphila]
MPYNAYAEEVQPKPVKSISKEATNKPSATHPKLEVTIKFTDSSDNKLKERLISEISLGNLKRDEYPAQTDFLFNRAQQEILDTLRALGYYQASLTKTLKRTAKQTLANFSITLGKAVKIRKIDIVIEGEGKSLEAWKQFKKFQMPLKVGERFTHENYTDTVNALNNLALNEGFMDAAFTERNFKVYPHLHAVDIHLHLDTKTAYQFGQVTFHGNQKIETAFLAKFAEFKPGDTFKNSDIVALQKSLIDSHYFGSIRVIPQFTEQKNKRIPVSVEVEESLKHHYDTGIGYGTDTGARLLFGFENRLINKQGHSYQVDSLFGERSQYFNFNYHIPGDRPAVQHWNIGFGYESTQSDTLDLTQKSVTADYNFQATPRWLINPFVSFESENYRYTNSSEDIIQTLLFGINLKSRWVNNDAYPTSGYRHSATLRGSFDGIASDSQFAQIELASSGVLSIMDFWRLHAKAKMVLTAADKDEVVPASYRYLLGGENLRGYGFESIGITSSTGTIEGAENMVLGSLDTDYRLSEYVGVGAFVDAGQLFNLEESTDVKVGAGFGLRGYTPVGIAKLDIAWPVSEPGRQDWRLHFSLGFDL